MHLINDIFNVLVSLIKANILVVAIVFVLYLIEINSDFKLFVKQFQWKKSLKNARIHRDRDQVSYFIFCTAVYVYDLYKGNVKFSVISFIFWFALLIFLSTIFGKIYDQYQGVDPEKADDDLSIK
jgi:hypothetical protein